MVSYMNFNITSYDITIDNLKIQVEQLNRGVFFNHCSRHMHGNIFYELHLVKSGTGVLLLDDAQFPLHVGDLYMTGPNIAHAQLTDENHPMEEYCLGMNVRPVLDSVNSQLSDIFLNTTFWSGCDKNGECLKLFEQIEKEYNGKTVGWVNSIKNCISNIVVELVRKYTGNVSGEPVPKITLDNKRMNMIDNFFLNEYSTLTENSLAEMLGLSVRQVQRFLKEHYNKTFSQMKKEARTNKALEFAEKGYSLKKIAEKAGYVDCRPIVDALNNHS